MYNDMLLPYDGTKEADKGVEHGIELAAEVGSTVHGLYVISLPGAPRAVALRDDEEEIRREYEEYGESVLNDLGSMAAEAGVDYESHILTGSPSDEIVTFAAEAEMDVIVIGSAYRGKLGNLIGGTTDKVVRSASVPVITRRMEADEIS
jgi:nucleotide-binding universal stress UspA family protein